MIAIFQSFNETTLRPAAVAFDIAARTVRALYFGFRAGVAQTGISVPASSVISGFIVSGLLFTLLWLGAVAIRRLRLKSPSAASLWVGTILFWIGCAAGIYFLGIAFYILAIPDVPLSAFGVIAGTAISSVAIGRLARYTLGR